MRQSYASFNSAICPKADGRQKMAYAFGRLNQFFGFDKKSMVQRSRSLGFTRGYTSYHLAGAKREMGVA